MNLQETSEILTSMVSAKRPIYVYSEPETLDFTSKETVKIVVYSTRRSLKIDVNHENARDVAALLTVTIFDKEFVPMLICWDIKSIISYLKFCNTKFVTITSSIVDLKIIESFRGIKKKRPISLVEAVNRINVLIRNPVWKPIYQSIHLPLMLRVLPKIETCGLLNEEIRKSVFPYYEIEGQANGRMNCYKRFKRSFLPHNMSVENKCVLKPRGDNLGFMCVDYRHCEVTVLQWLSKDEKLGEILASGQDLHRAIYKEITGDICDTEKKRLMSKRMFLPVMYGCGPSGLAENMSIDEVTAGDLVRRVKTRYSTAWNWMVEQQTRAAGQGWLEDILGRRRNLDSPYKARNFAVQGVASTVCQEKLIDLQKVLDNTASVVFSAHDGFGLVIKTGTIRSNYEKVVGVLESDSKICPGLSMKVEVKLGTRLDKMKVWNS